MIGWPATLASNLAHVGSHWAACERAAGPQVAEYVRQFEREWRIMVKHVLFAFYGGIDSPARKAAYVARRLGEVRRNLTAYLHRPDCAALVEALDGYANGVPVAQVPDGSRYPART